MNPIDLELHDAVLNQLAVDFAGRSLTLFVDAYLGSDDKTRSTVEIRFTDVSDMSCMADFANLATNRRAGNINYWVPSAEGKASYIYLSDGCIAVKSAQIAVSL
jgi:hypothetical protein